MYVLKLLRASAILILNHSCPDKGCSLCARKNTKMTNNLLSLSLRNDGRVESHLGLREWEDMLKRNTTVCGWNFVFRWRAGKDGCIAVWILVAWWLYITTKEPTHISLVYIPALMSVFICFITSQAKIAYHPSPQ